MIKNKVVFIILLIVLILISVKFFKRNFVKNESDKEGLNIEMSNIKNKNEIYLAGGCFWGVEGYFKKVPGVIDTSVGYANGKTDKTDYNSVNKTDHSETVKIIYDEDQVTLQELLEHYFRIIDPTSINKQGNDVGRQYRTGIYYTDENDKLIIDEIIRQKQKLYDNKIAIEVQPLRNFILAEDYHQDYLDKNPGGYCHINLALAEDPINSDVKPITKDESKLK